MSNTLCTTLPSDPSPPSWRHDPNCRGTFGLISTCVATLVIVAWSAVHVDIPAKKRGLVKGVLPKLGWLVIGLFAPDMLLFLAVSQWFNALWLVRDAYSYLNLPNAPDSWFYRHVVLRKRRRLYPPAVPEPFSAEDDSEDRLLARSKRERKSNFEMASLSTSDSAQRKHAWTFTHGFYATMGGFVIDTSPIPLQGTATRFILTPRGVKFVMKYAPELIPDISEHSICNQSKADGIAKALLVWQVIYFIVSCTARRAQSLPLSLLEVSTLAHALCTVCTYMVWWSKPLNISEPTLITGDRARELIALLLLHTVTEANFLGGLISLSTESEATYLGLSPRPSGPGGVAPSTAVSEPNAPFSLLPSVEHELYDFKVTFSGHPRDDRLVRTLLFRQQDMPWYNRPRGLDGAAIVERTDLIRWSYATHARACLAPSAADLADASAMTASETGLQSASMYGLYEGFDCGRAAMGLTVAILTIYGLPHLLGWNAEFQTPIEHKLWHVATIVLTALGVGITFMLWLVANVYGYIKTWIAIVYGLLSMMYIFASGYLLVASIRQLYILPPGTFQLPDLSIYIPSFS